MARFAPSILVIIIGLLSPIAFSSAATISSPYLYAWSNNVGYINFASTTVSDSALGGYAWSANAGWINMSPLLGGVTNDGTGQLSGSAWGAQLGWIDFSGVSIDPSTGQFAGMATGSLIGTLTFDCSQCDVKTDWRRAETPTVGSGGGGGGGRRDAISSATTQATSDGNASQDSKRAVIDAIANTVPNLKNLTSQPALALGATSENVRTLQIFLNALGFTISKSGPGSPGNETVVFGTATKAALTKFQIEFDIVPATGNFDAQTRAFVESLVETSGKVTTPSQSSEAPTAKQSGSGAPSTRAPADTTSIDANVPAVTSASPKGILYSVSVQVSRGLGYVWTPVRQAIQVIFSWFGLKL